VLSAENRLGQDAGSAAGSVKQPLKWASGASGSARNAREFPAAVDALVD
jgi:hypothetical protein